MVRREVVARDDVLVLEGAAVGEVDVSGEYVEVFVGAGISVGVGSVALGVGTAVFCGVVMKYFI